MAYPHFSGEPDMSLQAIQRRLDASRAAIRYRSADGRRHFCHDPIYRAAYVKTTLELRKLLRQLKAI